jgi:hypothetical protein
LGFPGAAAALTVLLMLVGGAFVLKPHLRGGSELVAGVPNPPAFYAVTEFLVPPHEQACMSSIAIDANSRVAVIELSPAKPNKHGGPPVDIVLRAPGYHAVVKVPGGYPGGSATLPIVPPAKRAEIGTACFVNKGKTTVALNGTTEPRTVSRSLTKINGRPVPGDIALTFLDSRQRPLLDEINETFEHAATLTDGLVPVFAVWVFALLVLATMTLGTVAAFYLALREDEVAGGESRADAPPG